MKSETSDRASEQKIAPRDRIVSTACQLFREHGIRGIGVDAIAEAASTNKMTLYRHFGSKDDLVCEALKHSSRTLDKAWEDLEKRTRATRGLSSRHGLKARAQCLSSEPYGCDLANAAVELKEQGHPAHAIIETLKMEQHSRLADLCRSTGVSDPELLADTLSMLLEGARVSKLAVGKEGPSMRFTRACEAAMVSFGLGAQASA